MKTNVVKKTGTYWDLWRREVQLVKHQYQDIQTEVSVFNIDLLNPFLLLVFLKVI